MKRVIILVFVLLLIPAMVLAETAANLIPDTTQWGMSRTKFKEANDAAFTNVEIGAYKSLMLNGICPANENSEIPQYCVSYRCFVSKEASATYR